jgi:hypothetical protein
VREGICSPLLAASDQSPPLHLADQLGDVPLRHKQAIGQFLLRDALTPAQLGDDIELRHAQIRSGKVGGGGAIHLLEGAGEPQPRQHSSSLGTFAGTWYNVIHRSSLALNYFRVKAVRATDLAVLGEPINVSMRPGRTSPGAAVTEGESSFRMMHVHAME